MDYSNILEIISDDIVRVRQIMSESLQSDIDLLNKANKSLIENSGKFVRPVLSILIAKACNHGNITDDTLRFAAAAELLHNATLFHDDVVDNSVSRRGKPTIMSLLGSNSAVLLGDYWLVKSMSRILDADKNKIEAIRAFSTTLGDLAEGEMLQLQKATDCDTDIDNYLRIIYYKTASLFVVCANCAALSVGASKEIVEAVVGFAKNIGIAFQIKDDILDYVGDNIGKPVCQDIREHKITLPLLEVLNSVDSNEDNRLRNLLKSVSEDSDNLVAEIHDYVIGHGGVEMAKETLVTYVERAEQCLNVLPQSIYRDALRDLAYFIIGRNK